MSRKKRKSPSRKRPAKKKKEPKPPVRFPALFSLMTVGMVLVLSARVLDGETITVYDLAPYVLWTGSTFLLCSMFWSGGYQGPKALPGAILALSAVGVLVRSRMAGTVEGLDGLALWVQPLGFVWMGLAWAASRRGRLEVWRGIGPITYVLGLALVAGLLMLGNRFRGAFYGPGGMTPSELLKLLIPFWLAWGFAAAHENWRDRTIWNPPVLNLIGLCLYWGILCALLVLQRDLGMVVLLSLMLLVMVVQVTRSWSWAVISAGGIAVAGWAVLQWMEHGARRVDAWLDPFADPTGAGASGTQWSVCRRSAGDRAWRRASGSTSHCGFGFCLRGIR